MTDTFIQLPNSYFFTIDDIKSDFTKLPSYFNTVDNIKSDFTKLPSYFNTVDNIKSDFRNITNISNFSFGQINWKKIQIQSTGTATVASNIISMDLENKTVKSTVSLTNGIIDETEYDFTNEYNEIQQLIDATTEYTINGINLEFITTLTNGKVITETTNFKLKDTELLYEAIKSYYSEFCGLWIKINGNEILFPVISREKQPEINTAHQPAIDGTPQYETLGKPSNKWSFEVYADDITKIQVLEQLVVNPVCEVKFDEIGNYKQCIITSLSYNRITAFKYNVSIELVIL